jgi:hypothetical protein
MIPFGSSERFTCIHQHSCAFGRSRAVASKLRTALDTKGARERVILLDAAQVTLLANKAALRESENWMGAHPKLAGFRHTSSTYEVGVHYHVAYARYTVDEVLPDTNRVVKETLPWCYASPEVAVFNATM